MEIAALLIPIYYTKDGCHTCRLDSERQCPFLGFRHFGQVPVCMKGEQHDLCNIGLDGLGFIEPDCDLADKAQKI